MVMSSKEARADSLASFYSAEYKDNNMQLPIVPNQSVAELANAPIMPIHANEGIRNQQQQVVFSFPKQFFA